MDLYSNNKLQALDLSMSLEKVSQSLFMSVKEKLDYHRLPAQFPIEATPLISKLLSLIDQKSNSDSYRPEIISLEGEPVTAALKFQIGRVVKENNQLHMNLIVAKEQIQSLEHRLFKGEATKHRQAKELERLSSLKVKREQELVEQLQQAKYKYNELMDFLHEDPNVQKDYIKRLMKHKHADVSEPPRIEPIEAGPTGHANSDVMVRQLEAKVAHRQQEIKRLQRVIEYDGVNLNKILKNFNQSLAKKQLNIADNKITYLQESYDKVKKENKGMKNKNGSKEALRAEVEKCHQLIDSLKKENSILKRNHQQQNFDLQKKQFENQRKIGKVKSEKINADKQILQQQSTIRDLNLRVSFLEKELESAQRLKQDAADKIAQKEEQNLRLNKKIQQSKVFFEYELEATKKRLADVEVELEETRSKGRDLYAEFEIKIRENQLKTESIINLEKIVNELIRKNSALADHTAGTLEESLKQSAELQFRNRLSELDRQLSSVQIQKAEAQAKLRALQCRFQKVISQNQKLRYENGSLRTELRATENEMIKLKNDQDEIRHLYKRQEGEKNRIALLLEEATKDRDGKASELAAERERWDQQEKSLKQRLRDLQIKISEEEGIWQVTRFRLQDKDNKIKQLQKLLSQTVQQTKALALQINQLQHHNHQLTRDKHRLAKKYEELTKDDEHFKATSFKNYESAISDNLTEISSLKRELIRVNDINQTLVAQYEETSNMLNRLEREKDMAQFEKISLARESELLRTRLGELQQIERALVLQNQSLRSLARKI